MEGRPDITGQTRQIISPSNPVIKSIRGLHLKKNRDAKGIFLAEGLKLIIEAMERDWEISTLVYARDTGWPPHFQKIIVKAQTDGIKLLEVSKKVLTSITRRDNPQMAVGIFKQNHTLLETVESTDDDLWIGLDRVRDPGNLGTIIRTADCVGAKGVILIGQSTDPWSLETVRATMGSTFNIKLVRCSHREFASWRKSWQGLVIGTHLESRVDYRSINYDNQPALLLMGNEQQGLSDNLVSLCTHSVLIPMRTKADSLNLAIATAIMAFEIKRATLTISSGEKQS